MGTLLACPFCRELFGKGEVQRCPTCDVALESLENLPPSHDLLADPELLDEPVAAEDVVLPSTHLGHGRGALLLLGGLGLLLFFLPWVEMTRPEIVSISGYDLARTRAGWLWGGAVGWFILLPLVWTRRTLYKMQGVRVICATFCAMTLLETAMIMGFPPDATRHHSVQISWGYALYASAVVSALGVFFSIRFGMPRASERAAAPPPVPDSSTAAPAQRAARRSRTLH